MGNSNSTTPTPTEIIQSKANDIRNYEQQYYNDIIILAKLELNAGDIYKAKREELTNKQLYIRSLHEDFNMMKAQISQLSPQW